MAAVVYGGSPRHHGRITTTAHHLHHSNALQQQAPASHHFTLPPPPMSVVPTNIHHAPVPPASLSYGGSHQSSPILLPPASYLGTGTPMSSTSQPLTLPHPQYAHQPKVIAAQSHYHHSATMYSTGRHHKRRSAVEMLAESKPFYVKSETVLDRHQQLSYRPAGTSSGGGSGPGCSPIAVERTNLISPGGVLSPSRTHSHHHSSHHHHHGHHRPANRRSASSSSDLLQTKLRKLLNTDSKDDGVHRYRAEREQHKYDTFSKFQSVKYNQELSVHPSNESSDVSVMFPSAFLSPQSLPPHPVSDDEIFSYGIDEPLILTEDYRAISPPAEYAADSSPDKEPSVRCNYQRSYSHSHDTATSDEPDYSSPSYNINSHKSLPDLHSQISRHSPHSEVLSCCSRGNRSNKSGGGSSLNRDSGGSSGHYTHRSEPCCKQQREPPKTAEYRRDSGSSTQHSGNSYYTYGMSSRYVDCSECRMKYQKDSECLLNFTTPEVPEAFQDEPPPPTTRHYDETKIASNRKVYTNQQSPTARTPSDGKETELSPPPGTFKRQKCLRFKHRNRYSTSNERHTGRCCDGRDRDSEEDRKPILRSKSDISDRYWNRTLPADHLGSPKMAPGLDKTRKSESLSQLEKFFDRLGLNDEKFEEIYHIPKRRFSSDNDSDESSTVFFSDVSTVDSTRLPDSTETQPQTTAAYRPTEPPSIVERNARIIKWLCNCRKVQLT